MMKLRYFFISIAIIAAVNAEYKNYKQYKVYKIIPRSEDVQVLSDLKENPDWYFWSDVIEVGGDVRIMVAPEKQKEFEEHLASVGISSIIVIEDVQKLIDDQLQRPSNLADRSISEYSWNYYQTLDEINEWLDAIVAEHPDVATLVTIGISVEGRPIRGVKIDYKKRSNPVIGMIEGGIHAREWISPATVTWIIKEFLKSTEPGVRDLAENIVWHIFPVVNPDGYLYTFTHFEIGIKGMDKLTEKHGTSYNVGTSQDILYPATGGSFDWVKGGARVPIVFLFELRDVGQYGFLLPIEQIIANNEEVMDGLVEMDKATKALGYYRTSSASTFGLSTVLFVITMLIAT